MYANEPEMAKDWEKKNEGLQKDRNELTLHIIDLNNMLGQARLSKNPKAKKYIKLIQKDLKDARKELSKLKEERDYKAEYKKFQSSTKAKKYRAELNKYNRQKGTYGNGDGKDASHKGGKIVGFEKESVNRGRAEKSRLKKEANMPDFNPMIDKALDEVIEEYTMARTPVIDKIAKLAKANKYGDVDGTKMNGKTAKQIIAIYNHPKMKRFKNAMKNYTADQFSDLTIKLPKVLGIKENDMNEAGMELKKLEDAIKFFKKKIEKQGRVTNARDEEHLKRLMKIYNYMGGRKIKENDELFEWLQEACWKGYEKKGMKTMFGKRYPNCVKKTKKKEGVKEAKNIKLSKDGYVKQVRHPMTNKTLKSVKVNGKVYRYNSTYKTYNSVKGNELLYKSDVDNIRYESVNEACWVGYKQVGMKDKGGRKVPNCVKEITEIFYESDGKGYGYTFEHIKDLSLTEAEYQGRKVKLGKIMQGDAKKFKVYVKNPKGNVVKVNFGQGGKAKGGTMKIRKSNPKARKSFRARHNCDNPGPRHKARYWSCRKW